MTRSEETNTIRVLIADDQPLQRAGQALILESADDIHVVAEAGNGEQAISLARTHRPDVVLMDVRMPGIGGIEATGIITRDLPGTRVIVLTTFNTDDYVVRALKLGADAFLLKDADPARLVEAIQRVAAGENVLAPDVTRTLITVATDAPAAGDPSARALVAALTEREREVAVLMTQGLTNNQIGTRLHLSLASVKSHLTSMFVKLGVDNRVSAAMIIRDAGL